MNVTDLEKEMGIEWCCVLLSFYVFTGEDCSSAFKGKGKVTPLKKLMKTPRFHASFRYGWSNIYFTVVHFVSQNEVVFGVT